MLYLFEHINICYTVVTCGRPLIDLSYPLICDRTQHAQKVGKRYFRIVIIKSNMKFILNGMIRSIFGLPKHWTCQK